LLGKKGGLTRPPFPVIVYVSLIKREKEIDMTYEGALKAINENLEKFRVAGDIEAFNATKVMKAEIIEKMGTEVAKEYVKLFGDV